MSTGDSLLRAADLAEVRERKYAQRKRVNKVALTLSLVAMAFGVFWLIWILWSMVALVAGISGLHCTAPVLTSVMGILLAGAATAAWMIAPAS